MAALLLAAVMAVMMAVIGSAQAAATFTQSVARTLDVTTQLVRETVTVTLDNVGAQPLTTYAVTTPEPGKLAFVQVKSKAGTVLPLTVTKTGASGPEAWAVALEPAIAAGEKAQLTVAFVYINMIVPLPAKRPILQTQLVRVDHRLHFFSPYPIAKERTVVTVPTGAAIIGKGDAPAVAVDANKVTYGPYTDVPAADEDVLFVHFENNAPFAVVTNLERTLEVSHWGDNLAVEEFFDVEHRGTQIEGEFNRLDIMRGGTFGRSNVITSFSVNLPITATEIYYRDVIGNISTSTLRSNLAKGITTLTMEPRYPVFGGWKTKWFHGWNEPLSTVLFARKDRPGYVLSVPLATLFENAAVEKFTLRVTLPEGATNIQLHSDTPMDSITQTKVFTYLDSTGRPVLIAKRDRLVNEHNGLVYVRRSCAAFGVVRA